MIAFKTQKPLSRTNIFPLPQTGFIRCSSIPNVLPNSSNSMLLSCVEQSFPSHSSNAQMMSESAHPASWYSLPNCHGFCGTKINPGQVYSLTHLLMLSSMQLIQLSTKLSAIFLFQQSNISHTSQNRSWNSGGFLFVYIRSMQQFTICKRVSGYLLVDSINNGIQEISGKHTLKKLKAVIIFSINVKIYVCFVTLHIGSSSITKSTMSPCFFERRNHCIFGCGIFSGMGLLSSSTSTTLTRAVIVCVV